jgi:hypothetical protein
VQESVTKSPRTSGNFGAFARAVSGDPMDCPIDESDSCACRRVAEGGSKFNFNAIAVFNVIAENVRFGS